MSKRASKKEVKRIYIIVEEGQDYYNNLSDLIDWECRDEDREFDVEVYKLEKTIHVKFDTCPRITVDGREWNG